MNTIERINIFLAKDKIQTKLNEVLNRGGTNKEGLQIEPSADQIDRATNESDRHFAAVNSDRDTELIKSLRNALERIEEGKYGECARCEGEIDSRRIAALPWAILCLGCQEHSERSGKFEKERRKLVDTGNGRVAPRSSY